MRRNAAIFVAISLVAGFGGSAINLVAGVWILDLTRSASLAGLAGLCVYAPTLAAPWLGALVDRLPRRPLVITVDLVVAALLMTLLLVRGPDQVWLIFAVLLAKGFAYVLQDAAESALLPAALPPEALGDVNGWRSSAQEGMKLIAPLAGAGLYAWQGGGTVALISAALPVTAAVLYAGLRLDRPPATSERPQVREGLAILVRTPQVRTPVLVASVAIGLSGFAMASVYARVTEDLHLPAPFLGVLGTVPPRV